jgi:hypothetical protein
MKSLHLLVKKYKYQYVQNTYMNESLDVSAQQTSLMSPLFIEVPFPSQESELSFTCLLVVSTTQKTTNGNDRKNEAEALLSYRVPPELACEC